MYINCVLCNEVSGRNALSVRLHHKRPLALAESAHFVALPDIQPLVSGHTLVLTKFHIPSFSGVSATLREELQGIVARARSRIADRHEAPFPFLFEHGPGDGPYPGCCVSHAHIHMIPLVAPVMNWLHVAIDGELRRGSGDVIETLSTVRSSYLYYQNADGEDFVISDLESPVPRQFIRQAVGRFLGIRHWNWKIALSHPRGHDHENVG